jgi:hypothetical protein
MKVTLDDGEMATAHFLATTRRLTAQAAKVKDKRYRGNISAIGMDILGTVSELAWSKQWGIYPDLSPSPRRGGVDSFVNGKRIDIKATHHQNGRLIAPIHKDADAVDVYVLAIVDENTVDFVGYAYSHELFSDQALVDLGQGLTHVLPQSKLHRFKQDLEHE